MGALNKKTGYRPEIDGLRAIAVAVVVLFHAGFPGFAGGFVGVDIFFVLSGYLITGLLWEEASKNERISLLDFYARRGRRLLPAVFVVLIATMIAGAFLLPADGERQTLAASAVAATLFVSNFYFWRTTSGYFGDSAEELPLLHTWTLSVEEQFYLVWPVVIISVLFLSRNRKANLQRRLLAAAISLSILSFIFSLWLLEFRPTAAFYLAPARAFELGAGAILALTIGTQYQKQSRGGIVSATLIFVGFTAVGCSVFLFNGTMVWPGWLSLTPVLGTVAILTGLTIGRNGIAHRILSVGPMVTIGKLSYSWYLWHWPFLVYVHLYSPSEPPAWQIAVAVLLSFLAAAASFQWIENPIRRKSITIFSGRNGALTGSAGILTVGTVVGAAFIWQADRELASSANLQAVSKAKSDTFSWNPECNHYQHRFTGLVDWRNCRVDKQKPSHQDEDDKVPAGSLVLWGDSHAHALLPTFQKLAASAKIAAVGRVRGGCRPINGQYAHVGQNESGRIECEAFNSAVISSLPELRLAGFERLVIASRWPPSGEKVYGHENWSSELHEQIKNAKLAGFSVTVMLDVPKFDYSVPKCLARFKPDDCKNLTKDPLHYVEMQNMELDKVVSATGIDVIDPIPFLCPDDVCQLVLEDGAVVFKDDNHLSIAGAEWLADSLFSTKISLQGKIN